MSIFEEVNQLGKERIVGLIHLELARDRRSYVCPECGNGSNRGKGDGLVWREVGRRGVPNWWCPSCGENFSNVDLVAAVEGIPKNEYAEVGRRLSELFPECTTDDAFSFQKKPLARRKRLKLEKTPARATVKKSAVPETKISADDSKRKTFSEMPSAEQSPEDVKASQSAEEKPAPKNYARAYEFWRQKYSLRKFIDEQGGLWRGFDYEFLKTHGAIYCPEYFVGEGEKAPAIILPYDENFYFWREVGGSRRGVPKGSRREKFYIAAAPAANNFVTFDNGKTADVNVNIITEGELDALSIRQAFVREKCNLFLEDMGLLAAGSANYARRQLENLISEYKALGGDPKFLVVFDNDKAGVDGAKCLVDDLRAAGFKAAQVHFGEMGGKKIDANDLLIQGADVLIRAVCDLIEVGGF